MSDFHYDEKKSNWHLGRPYRHTHRIGRFTGGAHIPFQRYWLSNPQQYAQRTQHARHQAAVRAIEHHRSGQLFRRRFQQQVLWPSRNFQRTINQYRAQRAQFGEGRIDRGRYRRREIVRRIRRSNNLSPERYDPRD